jgi:hypothetical protein
MFDMTHTVSKKHRISNVALVWKLSCIDGDVLAEAYMQSDRGYY